MNMIPRARMVHTKLWCSNQVASLTPYERLLFVGMITIADDDGRFRADEGFLKAQILPYDRIGISKVATMRDRIHEVGLIEVYEVESTLYGLHPHWTEYQTLRKDRAKPSQIPPPLVTDPQPDDNQTATEAKKAQANISQESVRDDAKRLMLMGIERQKKKLLEKTM